MPSNLLLPPKDLVVPSNTIVVKGGIRGSVLTPGGRGVSPGQPTTPGPGGGRGRGRGGGGSGGGNALLQDLIHYWKFNTSPGLLVDSGSAGSTLTNNGGATTRTGKLNQAGDLIRASSQYYSRATEASLEYISALSIVGWVLFDSLATDTSVISKYDGGANKREFALDASGAGNAWRFYVTTDGTAATQTILTYGSSPTVSTWHFFALRIDATGFPGSVTYGIRIDAGAWLTGNTSGNLRVFNGPAPLRIGTRDASGSFYMDGGVDNIAWYKNRLLSDGQFNQWYNSGNGLEL